jgi:hypothetical protein
MLLDFSDSSFVSDLADGKNCMTSSCTNAGQTVNFVKVLCNTTDSVIKGVCGKYWLIDWLIVFVARTSFHKLS